MGVSPTIQTGWRCSLADIKTVSQFLMHICMLDVSIMWNGIRKGKRKNTEGYAEVLAHRKSGCRRHFQLKKVILNDEEELETVVEWHSESECREYLFAVMKYTEEVTFSKKKIKSIDHIVNNYIVIKERR